jgi:hypothetical protein
MTPHELISLFEMEDQNFYFYRGNLTWNDVTSRVTPAMQAEGWEPLEWYFIEDQPGGWKHGGLVFWSRGAWVCRSELSIVTYSNGNLTLRRFSGQVELEDAVAEMQSMGT